MKVNLENRSEWPTPALQVLADWTANRAGLRPGYRVLVRGCKSESWGGRGGATYQRLWLDRHLRRTPGGRKAKARHTPIAERIAENRLRMAGYIRQARADDYSNWQIHDARDGDYSELEGVGRRLRGTQGVLDRLRDDQFYGDGSPPPATFAKLWPMPLKDPRYSWGDTYELRSRLELFVYILAHEAAHAAGQPGDPRKWTAGGRCDRDSMEQRCNDAGFAAVEELREQWPAIRAKIYKAMRADRDSAKRAKAAKAQRKAPAAKLASAQAKLDEWKRKQRAASNKVKTWARKVKYYEGREAATKEAK